MSKLTDALSSVGIYNAWRLVGAGHFVVTVHRHEWHGNRVEAWTRIGSEYRSCGTWGFSGTAKKKQAIESALRRINSIRPDIVMVKGPWRETWVTEADMDAALLKVRAALDKPKEGAT